MANYIKLKDYNDTIIGVKQPVEQKSVNAVNYYKTGNLVHVETTSTGSVHFDAWETKNLGVPPFKPLVNSKISVVVSGTENNTFWCSVELDGLKLINMSNVEKTVTYSLFGIYLSTQ